MSSIQALAACFVLAGHLYHVPPEAMLGIMQVESGRTGHESGPNFDGSYDIGLMQINSLWLPQLVQIWHVDYYTARKALRDDTCENVFVAAWILKQKIIETGSFYVGVAHYHSATPHLGYPYADRVMAAMRQPIR